MFSCCKRPIIPSETSPPPPFSSLSNQHTSLFCHGILPLPNRFVRWKCLLYDIYEWSLWFLVSFMDLVINRLFFRPGSKPIFAQGEKKEAIKPSGLETVLLLLQDIWTALSFLWPSLITDWTFRRPKRPVAVIRVYWEQIIKTEQHIQGRDLLRTKAKCPWNSDRIHDLSTTIKFWVKYIQFLTLRHNSRKNPSGPTFWWVWIKKKNPIKS